MRNLEDQYWKQIEELEWSKDHDYKRIEQYLVENFTAVESVDLMKFTADMQDDLMARFHNDWLADPGIEVGDDGWNDLTAEVVGRGKKFYKSITEHIRIWCTSCLYLFNGVSNDFIFIFFLKRHNIEWHIKLLAHRTSVRKVLLPRTITKESKLVFKPNLKIKGGYIVPLLFK